MNSKVLKTLEYNKILEALSAYADCEPAKEKIKALTPMDNISEINICLENTNDALRRIYAKGRVSFDGVSDIGEALKRLNRGASLNIYELLSIKKLLFAAKTVKTYYEETKDSLSELFDAVNPLKSLFEDIDRCILSENEISDDASLELKNIRRQKFSTRSGIKGTLQSMLSSAAFRDCLQDPIITMRDDRYCLPVRSEYHSQVDGILHDRSASGSTFFIEPSAVVNLNNELKQLELRERDEIERILSRLSLSCSEHTDELKANMHALTQLDFIFAKASYSKAHKATKPILNSDRKINLKNARHPLINDSEVVPINISVGDKYRLLIITGPNTGGKTVSLKTVGLLTLMAQSGLNIPADENSQTAVFKEVYADIGDEQSIEQSLSTFSSHMTNIAYILKHIDNDCLALFDEIGAGTDPTEGAALSISILNKLKNEGITSLATTHYSELKMYALSNDDVENAGCEFDIETLRPTYRLLIGVPGKSNAFAISEKLGISKEIINDASARLSEETIRFEDIISDLDRAKREALLYREELTKKIEETNRLESLAKENNERALAAKDKIIRNANEEAASIISDAKREADRAVKLMNKRGITLKELEEERSKLRVSAEDKKNNAVRTQTKQRSTKKISPDELVPGSTVYVISMDVEGELLSKPDASGNAEVRIGIFKSKVNINDLEPVQSKKGNKKSPSHKGLKGQSSSVRNVSGIKSAKSSLISPEINILGMTVDEGKSILDKYLDDACLAGLSCVRIVHGKGTGALRSGIQQYLKTHANIKSYKSADAGDGGDGVTVAYFK